MIAMRCSPRELEERIRRAGESTDRRRDTGGAASGRWPGAGAARPVTPSAATLHPVGVDRNGDQRGPCEPERRPRPGMPRPSTATTSPGPSSARATRSSAIWLPRVTKTVSARGGEGRVVASISASAARRRGGLAGLRTRAGNGRAGPGRAGMRARARPPASAARRARPWRGPAPPPESPGSVPWGMGGPRRDSRRGREPGSDPVAWHPCRPGRQVTDHEGASRWTRAEPALGDELAVAREDGVPVDAERSGQGPRAREPRTGSEQPRTDVVLQGFGELEEQRLAPRRVEDHRVLPGAHAAAGLPRPPSMDLRPVPGNGPVPEKSNRPDWRNWSFHFGGTGPPEGPVAGPPWLSHRAEFLRPAPTRGGGP